MPEWLGIGTRWTWQQLLIDLGLHFTLAALAASLVCYLTLTTSRRLGLPDSLTWRYSLWLALSAAIVSHVLEDYLVGRF